MRTKSQSTWHLYSNGKTNVIGFKKITSNSKPGRDRKVRIPKN